MKNWRTTITPPSRKANINFKEIWSYRDLIKLFVKRDFVSKYKQTILGPLWAIIQPLLTTVVFTIVFGNLANLTTSDVSMPSDVVIPSFLFYMIGTITWSYFSSTVSSTSNTFISNASIMGKVYYPRMVTPLSTALSNLISFFIQIAMFVVITVVCIVIQTATFKPNAYILLFPLIILQMVMLSTGFGIIVSSLTTKYRDLSMLVGFGLELWKYGTPVAYGLQLIPQKWQFLYLLNPTSPMLLSIRYIFFGVGYFNWTYFLISWCITLLIFFAGMVMFNRIERTFMDTI